MVRTNNGIVIVRAPLRISLGGGGTDLKSYYEKRGGFWISGAINYYIYVTVHETFDDDLIIKYSKMEKVQRVGEIQNDIIRETLKHHGIVKSLEVTSIANIPSGTGLGSSGTFGVALSKALYALKREQASTLELADEATRLQADVLKRPIGLQDQYIAAYGGITAFEVDKKGNVKVIPLKIDRATMHRLEDNLLMFFTGYSRSADTILKEQNDKSKKSDTDMIANLDFMKQLGYESKEALESGNLVRFGELMDVHWERKKERSGGMTNPTIDKWYQAARKSGAIGGKLIGAGGGGFLMFYTENPDTLRKAMAAEGLEEVRFKFDYDGAKVIVNE